VTTSKAHKTLVRRYLDAYNRGALDEIDELVTSDYVHRNNGAALTLAQFKRGAAWVRQGLPDFALEAADLIAEGDRVAARWIGRGTHGASMFGEPVTGKTVTVFGTTVYRFEGGRIAEDWEAMDEAELRRQVGSLTD